ncbi:hypothetical protein MG293_003217 [Ovis ammon polii]|uniref:Glycosylation-dependent cell adhesion molecule 1 n=1 Tax=Ovis ammon polii TaxID=230172 RepID=A0AAD4UHJ5_OVIAM|nr:hypothetical protein MG293_003217 [Ovis ammon polii]
MIKDRRAYDEHHTGYLGLAMPYKYGGFSGYVEYILYINKVSSSVLLLEALLSPRLPLGRCNSVKLNETKPVITVVLPGPWQKDQSSQSSQGEMTHVKTVHTCVLEMKDLLNKPGIEPEKNGCEEEKPSRLLGLLRENASSALTKEPFIKPEDETHLEAQPTDASAQFIISNLQISTEDLSKEPSISREDLISKEPNVIRSPRQPQNQNPKLPLSILKEKQLRNATLGSEETTEHAPSDASTTEGKLMELGHKIMKNLENTVKEIIKYLKSLFPPASEVVKP